MKFVPRRLRRAADNSRGRMRWRDWAKGLASVALVSLVVYLALGWTADWLAGRVSAEQEARWFRWVEIGAQPENDPDFARARLAFDRLITDPELRPLPYRLVWIDEPAPNAFALPGGLVGVTRGLLELIETEVGLGFILAHELGHLQHRHGLKRLGRSLLMRAALMALGAASELSVLDRGVALAGLAHTRGQETEADRFGLELAHRTFGDATDALEFFEYMHAHQGSGNRLTAMLRTHPLTEDRLRELRGRLAELPPAAPRDLSRSAHF